MSLTSYTLTVRCHEGDGEPLAGAKVSAQLYDSIGRRPATDYFADGVAFPTVVTAIADEDGIALLQLVPNTIGSQDTRWRVTATHPETGAELIQPAAVVQMPEAPALLSALKPVQPVTPTSEAAAAQSAAEAAAARDAILLDPGFIAVAADLTGDDTIGQVAAVIVDIQALAPLTAQITALAAVDDEIAALAPQAAAIGTLAPIAADIATLAPIAANITTAAGIASEITTTAGAAGAITVVAEDIAAVNTAATNIQAIIDAPSEASAAAASATLSQAWATGTEPGGAGTLSSREEADRAEAAANSITTSETPEPDRIPKPVTPTQFLAAGWLNPNEFPLANQQDRERFFRNVLQPVGIDIPPDVLFWPSPYREGGYEATVARPGTGWVFNNFGVLTPNGTDVLRRDFDPATGAFLGALAEPQRENDANNNDALDGESWLLDGVSDVQSSGETRFPAFVLVGGSSSIQSIRQSQSDVCLFSFALFRAGTHPIAAIGGTSTAGRFSTYDLNAGVVLRTGFGHKNAGMSPVGGGWWLCWAQRGDSNQNVNSPGQRFGFGDANGLISGDEVQGLTLEIALPHRFVGDPASQTVAFPTSPIITGATNVIRPADTLTLPQVGDRRRGFICWEGVMDFDPGAASGAGNQVRQFPFGRDATRQGITLEGNAVLGVRTTASSVGSIFTVSALSDLNGRLVRIAYWWDADSSTLGGSVDGVANFATTSVGIPGDPIRIGRADANRQGRSHTNWAFISYNYPSIAQIEALTGEVAP